MHVKRSLAAWQPGVVMFHNNQPMPTPIQIPDSMRLSARFKTLPMYMYMIYGTSLSTTYDNCLNNKALLLPLQLPQFSKKRIAPGSGSAGPSRGNWAGWAALSFGLPPRRHRTTGALDARHPPMGWSAAERVSRVPICKNVT